LLASACVTAKNGIRDGFKPDGSWQDGTKRHLVVDRRGTPLGVILSGANRHYSMMLAEELDVIPGVRSRPR